MTKKFTRATTVESKRPCVGQGFYFKRKKSSQKSLTLSEYQDMINPVNVAVSRNILNQYEKISYTKHKVYGRIPSKITTISEDGLTKTEVSFTFL